MKSLKIKENNNYKYKQRYFLLYQKTKMDKDIETIENKMMGDKEWQMKGEIKSKQRP